ncbi:tryptophan 7-halogenase [Myxococcota bacterium]|nr:tryptophan 7-halogenase [Myxococcota bacterium]
MLDRRPIPRQCEVLVLGGGPAGSATAGLLARDGWDVVLFDRVAHPRPRVGSSMLPQCWRFTDALGVSSKLAKAAFVPQAGRVVAWGSRTSSVRFGQLGQDARGGLHVERDVFDELLLRHAAELGVKVFERVSAKYLELAWPGHPAAIYLDARDSRPSEASIEASVVVDATGSDALIARQLGASAKPAGRKLAGLWGAFEGSKYLDVDGRAHDEEDLGAVDAATFVEKVEHGWLWHVPLRRSACVGLVVDEARVAALSRAELERYYQHALHRAPGIRALLGDARFVGGSFGTRTQLSQLFDEVAGDDYLCVGDAAGFVEPIFSHGILGSFSQAAAAAAAVGASLENPARRGFHFSVYRDRVRRSHATFRLIGLGELGATELDAAKARELARGLAPADLELLLGLARATGRDHGLRAALGAAALGEAEPAAADLDDATA